MNHVAPVLFCCHGNVKNTNMAVNLESKTLLGNWVEEVKSFTTLLNILIIF